MSLQDRDLNKPADERGLPPDGRNDSSRAPRGAFWLGTVFQDLRFALRTLRKSPAFTATAILTLALGIGANTAIFQLLDAVRLRSLPVADPSSLVRVEIKGGLHGFGWSENDTAISTALWEQIRKQRGAFSGFFAWRSGRYAIGRGEQEHLAEGLWVSGEMFPMLGIVPVRGRLFTPEDDRPGCGTSGAVISYGLWQSAVWRQGFGHWKQNCRLRPADPSHRRDAAEFLRP